VALVNEDHVEEFRRDGLAIDDRERLLGMAGVVFAVNRRMFLRLGVQRGFALEDGVEALNRRDDNLAR
jgi:hypothetical protein